MTRKVPARYAQIRSAPSFEERYGTLLLATGLFLFYCKSLICRKVGQQMTKVFKNIWNVITILLVTVLLILAFLLVGVRLFGVQVFSVLSGSMEPVYHVGSLIYVKEASAEELKTGDDITFRVREDTVVTHRIIGVEEIAGERRFLTKGVANDVADAGSIPMENVVGKPVFTIPYLGYLANFIQNPPGSYIAIAIGFVIVLLAFVPDMLFPQEKEKEEEPLLRRR